MTKVTAPVRIDISAGWSDADPFRREFGGAVLNAALDMRVSAYFEGGKLITSLEKVPSNSGLGTSGALRSVFLVASNPKLIEDKIDLIKRVNLFENAIIGQRAGFQDQAAAIFGGVNLWEFRKDGGIRRTEISRNKAKHFFDRTVLVFTGKSHQSANVHQRVFEDKGFIRSIPLIERMKELAKRMAGKIDNEIEMGAMLRETWSLQKKLHDSMESSEMKKIQEIAGDNYWACRCTGAGGGGCMIFYTRDKEKLIRILKKNESKVKNMKVLKFNFDYKGIRLQN